MTHPHHRAVVKYLRRHYGVAPVLRHGSKHPYLVIDYEGAQHRLVLSASPSDRRSLSNAMAQIRGMLGPPTLHAVHDNIRRKTMDEMTPPIWSAAHERSEDSSLLPLTAKPVDHVEAAARVAREVSPQPKFLARVAAYKGSNPHAKPRIKFRIPQQLADRIGGAGTHVEITQLDAETWQLRNDSSQLRQFVREKSGDCLAVSLDGADTPLWGASPAEATEVDGSILVVCPTETRVPTRDMGQPWHRQRLVRWRTPIVSTPVEEPKPVPVTPLPMAALRTQPDRHAMRTALITIATYESAGWRLVKVAGEWRWRMPDISLGEEEIT